MVKEREAVAERQARGIVCPICQTRPKVIYKRNPIGHATRRRKCPTCGLRLTTCERIVGGYSAEEYRAAEARLAASRSVTPATTHKLLFE